jgi:hypothetical protein
MTIAWSAAQGMAMEMSVAAMNRSRRLSRMRVARIAGTLQPRPSMVGMME